MNVVTRLVEMSVAIFKIWWASDDHKRADIEIAASQIMLELADLRARMEPPP